MSGAAASAAASSGRSSGSTPRRPSLIATNFVDDGLPDRGVLLPDVSTASSGTSLRSLGGGRGGTNSEMIARRDGETEGRPPYPHAMLAGGLGGTFGDMLMHSLDTVKTRQQGDPHMPPKYTSLGQSYYTILRQEGIRRGLYGGWLPALLGSFPGTVIFFGTYELSKRHMLDWGVQPHLAYLNAGLIADLAASVVYVPSEVLKTRLQLQGRYNNPYFSSGYNYRGTADAVRTIIRREGVSALFYGYKATLYRDLPFSALQFMFYEQFRTWALLYKYGPGATAATTVGSHGEYLGTPLELATGAAAGGLAGTITCPLDVVKTRLQTQLHPEAVTGAAAKSSSSSMSTSSVAAATRPAQSHPQPPLAPSSPQQQHQQQPQQQHQQQPQQRRPISTSSPSTHTPARGAPSLETSSVYTGLKVIYRTEGFGGWFRGVGPRFAWTSVQSGCMLFLYQAILRRLAVVWPLRDAVDERRLASV